MCPPPPPPASCPITAACPHDMLDRVAMAYICSPANPQGAVASRDYLADLLALAEKHDFRILADECYSEIWRRRPAARRAAGRRRSRAPTPSGSFVFHSLSKRSNLPGLRSGFVAGGPQVHARDAQAARLCRCAPAAAAADGGRGLLGGRGPCRPPSRALYQQKFARRRPDLRRPAGLSGPRGRVLPVAAGRGWRGGGTEAVARNGGAGSARRLPVARRRRARTPAKDISGSPLWPRKKKRSAG